MQTIQFQTHGTCCKVIQVTIDDNNTIVDSEFFGGCSGNLLGIKELIKGMNIDDVIKKLRGIPCGSKSTSCPDQLAQCLYIYKQSRENVKVK